MGHLIRRTARQKNGPHTSSSKPNRKWLNASPLWESSLPLKLVRLHSSGWSVNSGSSKNVSVKQRRKMLVAIRRDSASWRVSRLCLLQQERRLRRNLHLHRRVRVKQMLPRWILGRLNRTLNKPSMPKQSKLYMSNRMHRLRRPDAWSKYQYQSLSLLH
jgi:hypothetical protein